MIPIDTLFAALGRTLWAVSWQATVLIVFIGIAAFFFRNAPPAFRCLLWSVVLLRLCLPCPLETSLLKDCYRAIIAARVQEYGGAVEVSPVADASADVSGSEVRGEKSTATMTAQEDAHEMETVVSVLAVLWLAVVSGAGYVIIRSMIRTRRFLDQCPPVERGDLLDLLDRLRRRAGILCHVPLRYLDIPGYDEPSAAGVFRPAIYLPRKIADTWSIREIEPILLHELAHIKRRDIAVNLVQAAVQILYFFHPLVWLVNGRIRMLREQACDDMAVSLLGCDRRRYSGSILRFMEESMTRSSRVFSAVGLVEGNGGIRGRVKRIMGHDYRTGRNAGVFSAVLLAAVGFAGFVISAEQTASVKEDAGIAALRESGRLDSVIIRPGEPLADTSRNIRDFFIESEEMHNITFMIGQGWGGELRPPDDLKEANIYLAEAVKRYVGFDAKVDMHVALDSPHITDYPFLYITADTAFSLSKKERENFLRYLKAGGFAFIDNGAPGESDGEAAVSLPRLFIDTLGSGAVMQPIPNDHVIYHSFFDFDDGPPTGFTGGTALERFRNNHYLVGLWIGERLAAVYSDFGYGYRWIDPVVSQPQVKFGVNLVVFAVLQEGGVMTSAGK